MAAPGTTETKVGSTQGDEREEVSIFDFLMIDEPRDRRFLAGGDFFGRGGEALPDEMEGDEDAAPAAADDDDLVVGLSDADLQHNPFLPLAEQLPPSSAAQQRVAAGS